MITSSDLYVSDEQPDKLPKQHSETKPPEEDHPKVLIAKKTINREFGSIYVTVKVEAYREGTNEVVRTETRRTSDTMYSSFARTVFYEFVSQLVSEGYKVKN